MTEAAPSDLGAFAEAAGVRLRFWSDRASTLSAVFYDTELRRVGELELQRTADDPAIFTGFAPGLPPSTRYQLVLNDGEAVTPFARALPHGVLGPAAVTEPLIARVHPKRRIDLLAGEVFYELHIGTFTPEGTFASAKRHLPDLRALGVTVLELMPIAAFAGERGWGYDGVGLFAPFTHYGTPEQLSDFVDAAHALGFALVLDVVYNHLGPTGNFLAVFSDHYFDGERRNPWGKAPALEKAPFRSFILRNARYWLEDFGFDGLRLDAVHELEPGGDPHILDELARLARSLDPPAVLIAEDDRNDPEALCAFGIDGVWSDDFHHALHTLLTHERDGYYRAYGSTVAELARVIERGQLYEGQTFPLTGKPRGKPAGAVARPRLLYALQNHDQIGNRAHGDRIHASAGEDAYVAASLLLLFLPSTPLLFMGQEWASSSPFLYFCDHEQAIGAAAAHGRREEFGHFEAFRAGEVQPVPDPQNPESFLRSKLDWTERREPGHARVLHFYERALGLRKTDPVLSGETTLHAKHIADLLWVTRSNREGTRCLFWNTGDSPLTLESFAGSLGSASLLLTSRPELENWQASLPGRTAILLAC